MKTKNFPIPAVSSEPVIVIRDLYKSFGSLDVLKGVNLTVNKGENVVILGRSGTGKSVLIKILVGLLQSFPPAPGTAYAVPLAFQYHPHRFHNIRIIIHNQYFRHTFLP